MTDRSVIIKIFKGAEHVWTERVTVNDQDRITFHHGLGCLIDEGEQGKALEDIYHGPFRLEKSNEPINPADDEDKLLPTSLLYETWKLQKSLGND